MADAPLVGLGWMLSIFRGFLGEAAVKSREKWGCGCWVGRSFSGFFRVAVDFLGGKRVATFGEWVAAPAGLLLGE